MAGIRMALPSPIAKLSSTKLVVIALRTSPVEPDVHLGLYCKASPPLSSK